MPKMIVDGREIEVPAGITVLQACEMAGVEVPRFCYHERLSIAGNCRMCLVEMVKAPKPIASCAMPVGEGMEIRTNTPLVRKARQGVMEFLLINHPLDCPICDQGGECDLQDQAMAYGFDDSRYAENKRAVPEKYMGPLVKTAMTRCIHCTRCIRFASEVAGVEEIGAIHRGEHMEITTYLEQALTSELSGNVIDLCPVGALTSRPYAFTARPWELKKTESIDVLDAVGSAIRVDSRGNEVLRVLPRLNESVNEEWISDKTRFAVDGLRTQRLDRPYVRRDGRLVEATWDEAFTVIRDRLDGRPGDRIAALAGDVACTESMVALADLMDRLGAPNLDCRQDGAALDPAAPASYRFNTTFAGIEQADACLLIGTNPRLEAAVVNARLRRRWLSGGFKVGLIGQAADLTYAYDHLGTGAADLTRLAAGEGDFAGVLRDAQRPMLILGQAALRGADGPAVLGTARAIAETFGMVDGEWNGFNVLNTAAARVGGLDAGFAPRAGGRDTAGILAGCDSGAIDTVFLLGADEVDTARLGTAFVVYLGTHGDAGAHRADVILPGAAYTEKSGTWLNAEGRIQRGRRAIFPPGDAREDWAILRALSDVLACRLPYDSLAQLRRRMGEIAPHLAGPEGVKAAAWGPFGTAGDPGSATFGAAIADFYLTDPISRASATMAACSRQRLDGAVVMAQGTGTHG